MAFRWRAGDDPTLKRIRTIIAKKPYIFVIFHGARTPCPPLDPPMGCLAKKPTTFKKCNLAITPISHKNRTFEFVITTNKGRNNF